MVLTDRVVARRAPSLVAVDTWCIKRVDVEAGLVGGAFVDRVKCLSSVKVTVALLFDSFAAVTMFVALSVEALR